MSAVTHCSLAVTVNFLDLWLKYDDLSKDCDALDAALLAGVTDCNEICISHAVWLIVEPENILADIPAVCDKARSQIHKVLREFFA